MNRRDMILKSLGLAAAAATGVPASASAAKHFSPVDYALNPDLWANPQNMAGNRRLAGGLANIRIYYNQPADNNQFTATVFRALGDAFGFAPISNRPDTRIPKAAKVQRELTDGPRRGRLADELNDHLIKMGKQDQFINWLNDIGITGDKIQEDLLNAQAVFAVSGAINVGDGSTSYASEFTWIWPFC